MVARRHRAELRDRLVTLVDEEQGIVGQIFEQGRRRLARKAAGEEAAVILDPRAAAGRGDHLEVEIGALLEPLRLEESAFGFKLLQPLGQFVPDRFARLLERRSGGHIMAVREDADRSEEHTSELQSLMRISYAVFCLKK